MSHLINNEKDIIDILEIINLYKKEKVNYDLIKYTFETLIKKDNNNNLLTNYTINKRKYIEYASFHPKYNNISTSLEGITKYIELYLNTMKQITTEDLSPYIYILIFVHEIEHSIQYLIKENKIESPNPTIEIAYKKLFELFTNNNNILPTPIKDTRKIISHILYQHNHDNYLLERNANIETYDLLYKVAKYEDIKNKDIFLKLKNHYQNIGYTNKYNGSIEETFKRTLMYDKIKKQLNKNIQIPYEEKVRYGFPLNKEEKKLLLKQ